MGPPFIASQGHFDRMKATSLDSKCAATSNVW
jgi:hypothetical protein